MSKIRLNFLFVFIFLLAGILVFRLYQLQIIEADHWSDQAERQHGVQREVAGSRGTIFAGNRAGESIPLAVNRIWKFVYLSPREIIREEEDKEAVAKSLSSILGVSEDFVMERLGREESSFQVIKRQLSDEEVEMIKDLDIEGIYLREEDVRFYPQSSLASHVIGFLGGQETGQYGIEGYFDDILRGVSGMQEGWRVADGGGSVITGESAQPGMSIDLTIDYNIQFMAEKLISEAVNDLNASSGTVIAGNPETGEIMAMANYPNFDPNEYRSYSLDYFQNRAVQSLFEPGSVFKPFIMAMGIEEGVVDPLDTYYDTGREVVSGHTLRNYGRRSFGEVTMKEVMERSINTGMINVQQRLDNEIFLEYLESLGFFERTGIELQGETFSQNLIFKQGYDVNFANASFGQGIEVTPIQLFSAFSSLANGGELVKPRVTRNFSPEPEVRERVFSAGTTTNITSMLISTVEEGTARRAQIPGYYIAGKTGTAQIPWSVLGINRRGYSEETIQSFVGYGPLNAEFVILVKMDQPNAPTAEVSVVPVFRELAKYIIDYKQIPPDYVRDN